LLLLSPSPCNASCTRVAMFGMPRSSIPPRFAVSSGVDWRSQACRVTVPPVTVPFCPVTVPFCPVTVPSVALQASVPPGTCAYSPSAYSCSTDTLALPCRNPTTPQWGVLLKNCWWGGAEKKRGAWYLSPKKREGAGIYPRPPPRVTPNPEPDPKRGKARHDAGAGDAGAGADGMGW